MQQNGDKVALDVELRRSIRKLLDKLRTIRVAPLEDDADVALIFESEMMRTLTRIRTLINGLEKCLVCDENASRGAWTVQEMV